MVPLQNQQVGGRVGSRLLVDAPVAIAAEEDQIFVISWLRVSGTAKMPQIDQSVRHQLHTVVALLFELKAQQKPFELILPGEGPLHAEP